MKKIMIFSLIISLSFVVIAQDKQNQNVELPDFVITGKNIVNIQKVNKKAPPLLDIINNTFLQPVYSTEILKVKEVKNENINPLTFKKIVETYNGRLELKGGIYSIPKGNIFFSQPFSNGIFNLNVTGANVKAHVDNSDYKTYGGSAGLTFFVKNNSLIMPGARISIDGSYNTSKYKFYAVANPNERTLNNGYVSFKIQNLLSKHFIFNTEISDDYYLLKGENFNENLISVKGFAKIGLTKFDLASNIIYKKQILTNMGLSDQQFNYLFANPMVNFKFIDKFKVSLGFTYSHIKGNDYYAPYASIAIGLGERVTLIGEYSPQAEFITQGSILNKNKYFNTLSFSNLFFKKTNSIDISLKYEYLKFFEMDLGFNYYSTPNQPYYVLPPLLGPLPWDGRFDLLTTSAKSYTGYIKLLINPGDNGLLTAILKYNSIENDFGNKIPYSPLFDIFIKYGFNFNEDLKIEPSFKYYSSSYIDLTNFSKLKPFVDLSLRITKKINNNFDVFIEGTNLLNHSNFIFDGYKEQPISIGGGLSIRW